MLGKEGTDPNSGLPFVEQHMPDGTVERRYLTALPTPKDHLMRSLPPWFEATAVQPYPRSQWPSLQFARVHTSVPIIDQNGIGACVAYAMTSILMVLRDRAAMGFRLLSAPFLYTLINGGRDAGANGGDAIQAALSVGVCPDEMVQGRPIRPAGVSPACRAAAVPFRLRDAVQIHTFDEAVTAVAMGWQLLFDVEAGNRYDTNAEGVVAYLGGSTNHEQSAGEGLKMLSSGQMGILGRNSWGTVWGGSADKTVPPGMGYYTERHFQASDTIFAVRYAASDPNDPNAPPVLA